LTGGRIALPVGPEETGLRDRVGAWTSNLLRTGRVVDRTRGLLGLRLAVVGTALLVVIGFPCRSSQAQVKSRPVSEGSGPVSEISTNVGTGSAPVHVRGQTVRTGNPARLSGNSVRASAARDVRSGPVSEISAGPVSAQRQSRKTVMMTDSSAGAVKLDRDSAIGERIADPLRELGALQDQLRNVQPLPRSNAEALP
jgi:hypothetical protein